MTDTHSRALLGRDERDLVPWGPEEGAPRVHRDLVAPLRQLADAAGNAGFELAIASGYRSFERQLAIWNAKASGQRPLLDERGRALRADALSEVERLYAILRWSALPGASRHHWGTDLDVYDRSALAPGEPLALTCAETETGGPFAPFHRWLDAFLLSPDNPGFYRPYDRERGGVAPEPWHLSYGPAADVFARALTPSLLHAELVSANLALKPLVLERLPELFERYVRVPPWGREAAEGEQQ